LFFSKSIDWISFIAMETDRILLDAARRMDKEALVKIFDLYSFALYKYALRLCGDRVLADHVVGDVFAKLLDQLAAGSGPRDNLRSYLYEMTYHRLIDEARYSKRRAPIEVTDLLRADVGFGLPGVEDQILFQQILHVIHNDLTEDQRHVIVLRFLEEFSLRETAAILGKTADHVKVIQNRAIAKLRKALAYQGVRKVRSAPGVRSGSTPRKPDPPSLHMQA